VQRTGDDRPVRLNASLAQLAGLGALVIVATGLFTLWFGPLWGGLVHVLGLVTLVREGWGVEMSGSGVRFWGSLWPRTLSWAQIRDVETAGHRIRLCTRTGTHVLGAPRRGYLLTDRAFDAKYAYLRRAWERKRTGVGVS
jgi:hypothetical protein